MSSEQTKNLKMANTTKSLVYDVKGQTTIGVEKSYRDMSDAEIEELMKTERFSLTCAPGGENNRGMEIIGRMPIKGEGFTAEDIEGLASYFKARALPTLKSWKNHNPVAVLNLNALSGKDCYMYDLDDENQARVLLLRDWAEVWCGGQGWTKQVYRELASRRWDAEYLDPNKYRTEIVDGKEVKVRGKRLNKLARTNLCFVAGKEQEPAVYEGKGTIYDLKKLESLNRGVETLKEQIAAGLFEIGSKTKVEINVVEGNRYYNLKNTGIGFHGDTERVVVICISIGCDNYPMRWQWFKDGMPVGKSIDITLDSGDVYIMSEKAVGADWKLKSKYTLRHSAGAKKYRDLARWEKKRPAYEAKIAARVEKKVLKEQAKAKKKEKAVVAPQNLKKVDPDKAALRKYKKALKEHDWEDSDASFYRWVAIEAEHDISPNSQFFKEFYAIWTGKDMKYFEKMDMGVWEGHRAFYRNLCAYSVLW